MLNKLNECIARGIDFLYGNQLPDGEFPSFRIKKKSGDGNWRPDSAVFPTALIAHSLRFLGGHKVHEIRNRASAFLSAEMHPPAYWKYWSKKKGITIDPDLDDTCCAAAVLAQDSPRILEQNAPAILANRNQDGLFYTWLKPDKDRANDIDSVVNANVLFYLKEFEGIQKVVDYLLAVLSANREESSSWYYLSPSALYYMIARAWAGGTNRLDICSDIIVNKITQKFLAGGTFGNEAEIAMDLCSLLTFTKDSSAVMRPAIEYIVNCQQSSGSWPRRQFYQGPPPPTPRSVWFGSEALTTAFCLEALARFQSAAGVKMVDTASQLSDDLLAGIKSLKIHYAFERSIKMSRQTLLADRFAVGVDNTLIDRQRREKILDICRQMQMPARFLEAFDKNLPDAGSIGFGFEQNDKTCVYKVYLDFLAKWKKEIKDGPQAKEPFAVVLGFKWDALDNRKCGAGSYTWYPHLSFNGIREKISAIFSDPHHGKNLEIANLFIDAAAGRTTHEKVTYLEVAEKNSPRRSFDINVYRAKLQLKELYPLLQMIHQHYAIPAASFNAHYNPFRTNKFGHLSGGIGRTGEDFFTIYHGVETIER